VGRTGKSVKYPVITVRNKDVKRHTVGVVGGDTACLRTVVHHWTGRAPSSVLVGDIEVIRLSDANKHRDLIFVFEPAAHLDPWPGGPLIWMYPERGPSEPELAQLRMVLSANAAAAPALRVVLCLPYYLDVDAASADLDIISERLRYAVDPDVEIDIEAVWLSGPHEVTLSNWLAGLE